MLKAKLLPIKEKKNRYGQGGRKKRYLPRNQLNSVFAKKVGEDSSGQEYI